MAEDEIGKLRQPDEVLSRLGIPAVGSADAPAPGRFPDGAAFHVEIPSVEGPAALEAVVAEAATLGVRIHRASQGSGVALLLQSELEEMAAIGREAGIEVVLWAGLRSAWDISAMARSASGATSSGSVRGRAGLAAALEEALRAAEAGIAGVLMADLGVLSLLGRAKRSGILPADFVLKTSLALPCTNPETARCYVAAGATTLNVPTDVPLADLATIRAAVEVPLDCYVEGADDFAAPLRYHEIAQFVRVAAPLHLKFGLRNAPGVYPAGGHLGASVVAASKERVRRAAIGLETLARAGITA